MAIYSVFEIILMNDEILTTPPYCNPFFLPFSRMFPVMTTFAESLPTEWTMGKPDVIRIAGNILQ